MQCLERYRKLNNIERAQQLWEFWYKHFEKGCIHGYQCSRRREGHECNVGGRKHEVKMIGGAVLPIWKVWWPLCGPQRDSEFAIVLLQGYWFDAAAALCLFA